MKNSPMPLWEVPLITPDEKDTRRSDFACKVVLINCDCHTFGDVERQLMKAVRCTLSQARKFSWEVHSKGAAIVYSGHLERCEAVASVLEDIHLIAQVVQ